MSVLSFVIYFLIMFVVVARAYASTHTQSDFLLAGRSLNAPLTALGVAAADMSGWLMLALPGLVYAQGLHQIWMPLGLFCGAYLNWRITANRLRIYTEIAGDSLTIPSYLENRFCDHTRAIRLTTALVVLVFFTFYSASAFVGGAKLLATLFPISYTCALLVIVPVIVAYASFGGFLAVNWFDLFQGTLMLFALMVVPAAALQAVGGWQPSWDQIVSLDANYVDVFHSMSWVSCISMLAWGLGYFGQPHILVRFMAARCPETVRTSRDICMSWMLLSFFGAILTGFLGIAFFAKSPIAVHELVFIHLAESLFSPWMFGILIAAVLSAIMSTIAAQLMACSSAVSEDFYRSLINPRASQQRLIGVGRVAVLVIALLALYLARDPNASILSLVKFAWAGLGASFGPVVLLSLFWRRMNYLGAIAGMCVGMLLVFTWPHLKFYFEHPIFELYEMVPGFFVNMCTVVVISLLTHPPPPSVTVQFQQMLSRSERAPEARSI